jgi:predicted ATPase/DNA-binding SARP family transcriptional activator
MEFRVLGPLEVLSAGRIVDVASPKQRALLARLIMSHGTVVPVDDLVTALWGEESPTSARNSLQSHVSRLRETLKPIGAPIEAGPVGYRLSIPDAAVDAVRFEQLIDAARAEPGPAPSVGLFDEALAQWHGPAYAEFADEFARPEAVRLEELRVTAREDRAEALLATGPSGAQEAIATLEALAAEHPVRERPPTLLMRALYRVGRHAEALSVFRAYRERLDEELGLEPSEAMRTVQQAVLRQALDAELAPPPEPPSTTVHRAPRRAERVPSPRTSFVGRDEELATVNAGLIDARIVTLLGPGGAGKTRLATEVARRHGGAFAGGVEWVGLAAVRDEGAVAYAVADALGIQDLGRGPVEDGLITALYDRRALVVFDNCEHVLDATAHLVEALIAACPDIAVVATSRERLGIDGEQVVALQPLASTPDLNAPAVRLFLDRLSSASPSTATPESDLDQVAALCTRLDGLPLALELAAARASTLGIEVVSDRASGGLLDLLDRGRRTADERHRSLRAVVDWSYRLLDEPEQRLFERLSIFVGGFSLERAEVVCGDRAVPARQIGRLLAELVEKSMVVSSGHREEDIDVIPMDGDVRHRILETLRDFAEERLVERGEQPRWAQAHALHMADIAQVAASGIESPAEGAWMRRLASDVDDLRAAHVWARDRGASIGAETALRLSAALHDFAQHQMRHEMLLWADVAASLPDSADHPLLPAVLGSAANAAWLRGDLAGAVERATRALNAATGPDDPHRNLALHALGNVALFEGRFDDAVAVFDEQRALASRHDLPGAVIDALGATALTHTDAGRPEAAAATADEALALAGDHGVPSRLAWALYTSGRARAGADPEAAIALWDQAREVAAAVDNPLTEASALVRAVALRGRIGDTTTALTATRDALERLRNSGSRALVWVVLRGLVPLLVRVGVDADAMTLYGVVTANLPPTGRGEAEHVQRAVAAAEDRLGPGAAGAARTLGSAMRGDEAIAAALNAIDRALAPV